jgi:hypothetical protein
MNADQRSRIERTALALAFEANAIAEVGEPGSERSERLHVAARRLERDVDEIASALPADDRVLVFARLVLRLLPEELDGR